MVNIRYTPYASQASTIILIPHTFLLKFWELNSNRTTQNVSVTYHIDSTNFIVFTTPGLLEGYFYTAVTVPDRSDLPIPHALNRYHGGL